MSGALAQGSVVLRGLAQLGEAVRIVEFELIHDGCHLEIVEHRRRAEVGEECRVRGVASGGHPEQALPGSEAGGVDDVPAAADAIGGADPS